MATALRIVTFKGQPDVLLIFVGSEACEVKLPVFQAPFVRDEVAQACQREHLAVLVVEQNKPGWGQALCDAQSLARNARKAQQHAELALRAQVLKGSVNPEERDRAVHVARLHTLNGERVQIKKRLAGVVRFCVDLPGSPFGSVRS